MSVLKEWNGTDWVPVGTADTAAASSLPDPAPENAGKFLAVNTDGDAFEFAAGPAPTIGYVHFNTNDDGDSPSLALVDTGSLTANRSQCLTGRAKFTNGSNFRLRVHNMASGFEITYASVYLVDPTFENGAWYSVAGAPLDSLAEGDFVPWDPASETLIGTGVAIDGVDPTKIDFSTDAVYDYRIVISATVA